MANGKHLSDRDFKKFLTHLDDFYFNQFHKGLLEVVLDGLTPNIPEGELPQWYFPSDLIHELAVGCPISETETIGNYFLHKRGWREGSTPRLYFSALLAAPTAIWEITDVKDASTIYVKQFNQDMAPIMVNLLSTSELLDVERRSHFFVGKIISLEAMGMSGLTVSLGSVPLSLNGVDNLIKRVEALTAKEKRSEVQSQFLLQQQALLEMFLHEYPELDDEVNSDDEVIDRFLELKAKEDKEQQKKPTAAIALMNMLGVRR